VTPHTAICDKALNETCMAVSIPGPGLSFFARSRVKAQIDTLPTCRNLLVMLLLTSSLGGRPAC
jgi:hypothetical protein